MRVFLVLALGFVAMACDKTIEEVKCNRPAVQTLEANAANAAAPVQLAGR